MKKILTKIMYIGLICMGTTPVFAQFAPPTGTPPSRNVPAPLNTGNGIQTKNSALVIQQTAFFNSFGPELFSWIGFATDSSIGFRLPAYAGTNPDWTADNQISLDTNAPISINGAFITRGVETTKNITANSIYVKDFIVSASNSSKKKVCINPTTGIAALCTGRVLSQNTPQITLNTSESSIAANTPTSVNVSWSASGVDKCDAIQGPGFYTKGSTSGTDKSNIMNVPRESVGNGVDFSIMCSGSGKYTFAKKNIRVLMPVELTLVSGSPVEISRKVIIRSCDAMPRYGVHGRYECGRYTDSADAAKKEVSYTVKDADSCSSSIGAYSGPMYQIVSIEGFLTQPGSALTRIFARDDYNNTSREGSSTTVVTIQCSNSVSTKSFTIPVTTNWTIETQYE